MRKVELRNGFDGLAAKVQAAWLLDPIVEGIRAHVFAAEKRK
jgi:hypothetical protein